jgi:hypothetical protein
MSNQNPYIEEEQTTQWPKEKKYKRTNNDLHDLSPNQNPYIEEDQTTQWPKERTNNDLQNIHIKLKIE